MIRSTQETSSVAGKGTSNVVEKTASHGARTYKLLRFFIPCVKKIKCWVCKHFSKPSQHHQHLLKQGLEKFHRAVSLATVVGKGISKITEQGYIPLTLHSKYIEEIVQQKTNPLNAVRYLGSGERSPWTVNIESGKLFRNDGFYFTSENKTHLESCLDAFVIAPDKTLFAGAIELGKFHHSSFLAGGAAIFAGELETDGLGKVVQITNRSGHYRPQKEHLVQALELFCEWKIDLSQVRLTEYSSSRPGLLHIYNSAERYLLHQGLCSPDEEIDTR